MAKLAINVLIENRKKIEKESKVYSVISFLLHLLLIAAIFFFAGYQRYKQATKPKVYRVSIATLPSLGGGKNSTGKTSVIQPAKKSAGKKNKKNETKTNPKPKKKKTPKKVKGINTKKTKKKTTNTKKKQNTHHSQGNKGNSNGMPKKGFANVSSSIMDLDTTSFDYAYYLAIVRDKIGNNWIRTYTGNGKVKIYFKIMKNGEIKDAQVEVSSGNPGLDKLALQAVLKSNPLPPLPEGFRENYIGIHIWFNYEE